MMSVCGYQTNISLNYQQLYTFFYKLNENCHLDPAVEAYITGKDPSEFASLKEIVLLIHSSYSLNYVFDNLKRSLVNSFVEQKNYIKIYTRMGYYNSYKDGRYLNPKPEEKCTEIVSRLLFPKPPLLYTEYRKPGDDFTRITASIIYDIRSKYGYCKIADRVSAKSTMKYDLRYTAKRNRYTERSRAKTETSPIISFGSTKIYPIIVSTPTSPTMSL